jgi:hypothetical protein
MAAGLASDFKVYKEYVNGRINELLAQMGDVFNGASNGALLSPPSPARATTTIRRCSPTSPALRRGATPPRSARQTDTAMTQDEHVKVKLNRKIIPVAQTRDAFRKIFGNFSSTEFTDILAEQAANAMQIEMCDTALLAVSCRAEAADRFVLHGSVAGFDLAPTRWSRRWRRWATAPTALVWVMHSKPYFDLVASQINANITSVSNFNVATGTPITLNRPVIVSDSASLISS